MTIYTAAYHFWAWVGDVTRAALIYVDDTTGWQVGNRFSPATDALAQQGGSIFMGSGVPSNSNGTNGDVYLRTDTPGVANQRIYVKSAGTWVGIL